MGAWSQFKYLSLAFDKQGKNDAATETGYRVSSVWSTLHNLWTSSFSSAEGKDLAHMGLEEATSFLRR